MDAQEAKKNTAGGIVAVLFNAKGVKLSVQDVAFAAKIIEDFASAHSAQIEAATLYCDDCGEELQRESCNHVRRCNKCWAKAEAELVKLRAHLQSMIGWLGYAEECDEFYFSEEQAPGYREAIGRAREALGETGPEETK
jgi:hypothetical protein